MTSIVAAPAFNNNPTATTSIKTSGYTVPAGKYAYVIPKHWNCTLDGDEACVSHYFTKTLAATSTNSDTIVLLSLEWMEQFDNVNVTVTRTSGTAKELDGRLVFGDVVSGNNSGSLANTLPNFSNLFSTNIKFGVVDSQVTGIDRDFPRGNRLFNPTTTIGFQSNGAGTIPSASYTYKDMFYQVDYDSDSGATTFQVDITGYKVPEQGFWIKTGQVLAGDRWLVVEYTS